MNDAIAGAGWLLANAVLISTAWRWHRRLFPADGMGFVIIHTVVLCWACVVGVAILLGSIGALSPGLLVAGVCVLCIAARMVLGGMAKRWPRREVPELFAAFDRKSRWWAGAWGVLGAVLVARIIIDGLLVFPMDWDTLAYHLPLIDHWIRTGTLYVRDCAFWYCPGNNEVLGLWCVGLFSGDFLISLNNLPAVVLLAAATVELAGLLNVSRPLCHLAAMAVVATEVTWRQAISAENDIAVAALFFATLVYGLRFARHRRRADMWLAGIAVGLLTGIKYFAVGYAAAAGVSLLVLLAIRRRPRDVFAAAGVGIAGVVVFGAYWYLRNTYLTGAPLYPKGLTASTDLWAKIRPESHYKYAATKRPRRGVAAVRVRRAKSRQCRTCCRSGASASGGPLGGRQRISGASAESSRAANTTLVCTGDGACDFSLPRNTERRGDRGGHDEHAAPAVPLGATDTSVFEPMCCRTDGARVRLPGDNAATK